MRLLAHAVIISVAGYLTARIVAAIATRLLSPSLTTCRTEAASKPENEYRVDLVARFTFCFTALILLFIFSDVLNVLIATGGISTMPIYAPKRGGLFPLCSYSNLHPGSMPCPPHGP